MPPLHRQEQELVLLALRVLTLLFPYRYFPSRFVKTAGASGRFVTLLVLSMLFKNGYGYAQHRQIYVEVF